MARKSVDEWIEEKAKPDPRLAELEAENKRLSTLLGLVEDYRASAASPPGWVTPKRPKQGHALGAIQLSDTHFDENVDPAQVNGLNAYSREIAELRLRRWADRASYMARTHAHQWDGAICFWGGDIFSGMIHEELRETNADYMPSALLHYAPLVASALDQVADAYGGKLFVPAVAGNHDRMTHKPHFKGRALNSWNYLFMHMVAGHFKDRADVRFEHAPGSYFLVPAYDRWLWETHGDCVKGGGGWAGIWSPLGTMYRRAVEMAAAHGKRIDYVISGHWHTTVLAHARGLVCNGSMKGYDEFASGLRLKPEPAMQNWWVMTPEHGVTMAGALFLEDRKREGW